ncbi:MAG: GAF domain-containing protein [Aphanothece sp. CMT-3BRIN-NPC111]|jgi:light-regulated signal transduction histidine kinase (bacteriophytochrome)|nr:GAF domain-containing protein [Aphanothece sp. CMT-3BRIN-NPC111]
MSQEEAVTVEIFDFSNWEQEQIHIPGSIQPHGILFVLEEPQLKILQVSNNTDEIIGIPPEELLNKTLSDILDGEQIDSLHKCLLSDWENINPIKISIKYQDSVFHFDGIIHRSEQVLVLELEPVIYKSQVSFFSFHNLVKAPLTKIQKASNLSELSQTVVKEVRRITGFDRVMLYKFDTEGSGAVIAEDKLDSLIPYLDLHYPALDIPKQARKLFALNWLRLIPNFNYQPSSLIPAHNPITNSPIDLSYSVLRSVSPCHIEYLTNMGVTGSMSISILKDKKLWGLIACHHYSPKYVPYELRTVCEFLGQVMSLELTSKEENEDKDYKIKLNSLQSKLLEAIRNEEIFVNGLVKSHSNLLDLVSAEGVAICSGDYSTVIGKTPDLEDIQDLMEWVENQLDNNIFYTDSLPKLYPKAENFKDVASGVLALSISQIPKNYILWFRPEVLQTVNWGGNPKEEVEVTADGSMRLSPRKSFELWQETVRLKSLPWKKYEIDEALELRSAIIGIVLRKADELAKLNTELERSNNELDAFAYIASHDLKEPLRGIHNYSSFLIEDYAGVLTEDGVSKLQTLVRLTQRMEDLINSLLHFSRLGRVELSMQRTDLNELLKSVIDVLSISLKETRIDIRVPRRLPVIVCDKVQVSEVFSNLIGNALKYNDREDKWVEIGFLDSDAHSAAQKLQKGEAPTSAIVFYIKDNGIGIRERHLDAIFRIFKRLHAANKYGGGTGAGLTIAKKIVERHGGRIWVESTYGQGSTFYFTLQE